MSQRLRQKFDSSRLHRLHRHRNVTVTADEDNRHVGAFAELLLQVETAESREAHIENEAAGSRGPWTGQEFLRGRERLWLPPCARDEQLERLAKRDVVVDD